jgi:hypothetical protein
MSAIILADSNVYLANTGPDSNANCVRISTETIFSDVAVVIWKYVRIAGGTASDEIIGFQ